MNYDEAVNFLKNPLYNITRPGLGAVTELLELLGNPQDGLKYVHVAGTNGKGSVSAMMESALRHAGYKTGMYTSPFIERFTERIRVGEEEIPQNELARLTQRVRDAVEGMIARNHSAPTIFEMVTAVAFMYFFEQKCDIVILEVGMGGRLDATNVIKKSEVSVITRIGMDHIDFLGNTIEEITAEKAGIIKEACTVVSSPQRPEAATVISETCKAKGASLISVQADEATVLSSDISGQSLRMSDGCRYHISLLGKYQISNVVAAVAALKVLKAGGMKIPESAVESGLAAARWKGRLEIVLRSPLILIDGAHNLDGAEALADSLFELFPNKHIVFVMGVLADKDVDAIIDTVLPLAERFLTVAPSNPRALPAEVLAGKLRERGCEAEPFSSASEAIDECIKKYKDSIICVFGSLYYIGEARAHCIKL